MSEKCLEVSENLDNVWDLEEVVDYAQEEEELMEKYKYVNTAKFARMTAREKSDYLFGGLDWTFNLLNQLQ